MTAIDRYSKAKAALAEAQAWANLAVAPNKGKYSVVTFDVQIQDRAQSAPAQRMPLKIAEYVNTAATSKADNVVALALTAMQEDLTALAELARQEYAQIAADAGVTLP